ncbi:MAG: PHP-associated domain-containing protein [Verrucomicrobiota bacterium]
MPKYRVDLHNHCNCDPIDVLDYSAEQLIDQAKHLGIDVLSITPHRDYFIDPQASAYAKSKGILLIPGVERIVDGKEILILNADPRFFPNDAFSTKADLEKARAYHGDSMLIVAPHPFYPRKTCAHQYLDEIHYLLDAVEFCHFYFPFYNPNQEAEIWAEKNDITILANSDAHQLKMVGYNSSLVEAKQLTAEAIFQGIRDNLVSYEYKYMDLLEFVIYAKNLVMQDLNRRLQRPGVIKRENKRLKALMQHS